MAWTNERLKFSSAENVGLKTLWKMLVFENGKETFRNNDMPEYLTTQDMPNNMSLLKFFAINALELSAPASPLLLQQQQSSCSSIPPPGWLQLAGHPESIAPAETGTVRKRISCSTDSEAIAYLEISKDPHATKLVPRFKGIYEHNGEAYLLLQDLLHGFKDPAVMDIKMGRRTFLESEVTNDTLRPDLYKKMVAVNNQAPTSDEHERQAITKLRYMLFREQISSSECKGFRIEALKMKGAEPITNLKTCKNAGDIEATISNFLNGRKGVTKELIKRLKSMRQLIEKSEFFQTHEVVGSSVFIVFDEERVGAWLIDFAKARRLPTGIKVDHRRHWVPGNCEEGLLHGIDELIKVFEGIYADQTKVTPSKYNSR
ncbi:hypothetical protein HA402_006069 [Bradysia odoriphaga]|nr:hypothetical protein HA402_006069 [Bradysia odoriphaga]